MAHTTAELIHRARSSHGISVEIEPPETLERDGVRCRLVYHDAVRTIATYVERPRSTSAGGVR